MKAIVTDDEPKTLADRIADLASAWVFDKADVRHDAYPGQVPAVVDDAIAEAIALVPDLADDGSL